MTNFQFAIILSALCILAPVARAESPLAVPVDGRPFHAELVAIDANWQIAFHVGQQQRAMPAADLVCWGQCAEQGRAGALVLADGSLVTAEVVAADKESLTADSDALGTIKLPLEAIAGIVFRPPSNRPDRDKLFNLISPLPQAGEGQGVRAASGKGEGQGVNQVSPLPTNLRSVPGEGQGVRAVMDSDRLLLDNGDELSGLLTGIADDGVKWETDVGPVEIKTDRVVAIIFNPALKRKSLAKESQLRAWVGLSDGSRLLATQLVVQGNSLKLTAAGQPLAASQSALVFLQPLGGRAVYLSDLKPAEYRQTPYLDLTWPYQTDRNVTGGFLRCGGRLYLKGLGVHSAARLEYTLNQSYKRFEAELGIDDSTDNQGSVQFRVLLDGQEKYASPILRGGNPPLPMSVDLTGAKKLELVVDYADRADVLDHADWLNTRLTR